MEKLSYLKDSDFLKALDNVNNKFYFVKIEVLDKDEQSIRSIEGRIQQNPSISINGDSSVRRTCNISFIAEQEENDLTDVNNLLSISRKIKIFEGLKNSINRNYDDIIWFPLGIFVIIQPNIINNGSSCIINLSCKDKMALLNGECAGNLPTSITFHEYDQIIGKLNCEIDPRLDKNITPNNYTVYCYAGKFWSWTMEYGWEELADASSAGERVKVKQRLYDIIKTLVCNYGGISLDKIMINDIPLQIKQIVRYVGSDTLYYNTDTGVYSLNEKDVTSDGVWKSFKYNEDVGYIYTDFVYPGELISGIGDNICTVLDKIKNALGNYEYFFDINGNFVFQQIKNYLNNSYDITASDEERYYRLDNNRKIAIASNGLSILDDANYEVDFHSNTKSLYTFSEGNGLVSSYTNAPNYNNIKNDFHVWGENDDGFAIHYHIAIKQKPQVMNTYRVVFLRDAEGEYTGGLRLAEPGEIGEAYTAADWRAELYLQGLSKWQKQIRPDIYEQELLDLFDSIYDFRKKEFKADIIYHPNDLLYFFDYLEPVSDLYDCSVDMLNSKIYSYEQDKINKLYNVDIPNVIMIDLGMDPHSRADIIERCEKEGQPYSNVSSNIYSAVAIGTSGYTAQETIRELLYQYTNYNENITIQSIPIYYLDVNSRITVSDSASGVYGDYIIKSISLPLNAESTMTITAKRALERI